MKATTSILSHQSLADKLPVINKKLKLNKQEDAQEFLISVFDRIVHEEVVRHSEKQSLSYCAKLTTGIDSLFGFWLETTSVCLGCGASHTTYSSHRHLLIPTSGKTVQKGIDAVMSNTETVQGYACPACHVKQTCSKSLQFHTYPKTLVVTVDRFVNSENDSKDGTPLVMNRKISVGTATYSFRSSVIHHGPVKTAGHYTCTAVCPDDSCVELNDCEVKPHSNSAQAYATLIGSYLIFYQLESNMVLKVVKRSRIPTPTKLSPASKKWKSPFEKKLSGGILQHLSPKKPGKTLTFGKSILKQCASASELLAEPLQSDNSDQYHKPTNSRLPKQVHKSNEQNLRAALPKDTLSQSSHECAIPRPLTKAEISQGSMVPLVQTHLPKGSVNLSVSQHLNREKFVKDCGIRNNGGTSHICAALQMLLHVPEVSAFVMADVHRKTCRSFLCCSCALFKQLNDLLLRRCSLPSFFINMWERQCNNISEELHQSSFEFLFRLITTLRSEQYQQMENEIRYPKCSIWDTLYSHLFSGRQIIEVWCKECSLQNLPQEFLSVEIQLHKDKNTAFEIEKKLAERMENLLCCTCNKNTLSWKPISITMPRYLLVHMSLNCRLEFSQVRCLSVYGIKFQLKSFITQATTSPQALFTTVCEEGVSLQFEDAQVKKLGPATMNKKCFPPHSSMTLMFVQATTITTPPSAEHALSHHHTINWNAGLASSMDAAESSDMHSSQEVNKDSRRKAFKELLATISCGKHIGIQTDLKVTACNVQIQTDLFDYDRFKLEESDFKSWIGLTVEDFEALYNLLGGTEVVLRLKQKYSQATPKKISVKTRVSGKNRLLLFLLRLRQGFTLKQLSFLYRLSEPYISDLFYVMTCHLYETLREMSKHVFASAAHQSKNKPRVMKPFKNLRVILDGVSFNLETPSNFEQQGNTWSTYKHHNVALFIVGISCHGATVFALRGWKEECQIKLLH
ncbi:uncharacterized protein LOC117640737 [Thrips palmi]|uniref:Uncharacterized protein LOC117640737 n=1 Tax=Thrips palmi TaxID=161013 RepID=A0A6P8Y1T1_THRPL|nr:uncharacterized protein LOC117640737 [Thrips palmi]